jgi:hypothetical protein
MLGLPGKGQFESLLPYPVYAFEAKKPIGMIALASDLRLHR